MMNLNTNDTFLNIGFTKLRGLLVRNVSTSIAANPEFSSSNDLAHSYNAKIMQLGYILERDLMISLAQLPVKEVKLLGDKLLSFCEEEKGAKYVVNPMYKNFPMEVDEMVDFQLYLNALSHYWTFGVWSPDSQCAPRKYEIDTSVEYQTIHYIADRKEITNVCKMLLSSNESLSEDDKNIVTWFIDNNLAVFPETIPFKENLCLVAAKMMEKGWDVSKVLTNATDILRVAHVMCDGDPALTDEVKYKFSRKHRRLLCKAISKNASVEDLLRHKQRWVRLAHALHVGEYGLHNKFTAVRNKKSTMAPVVRKQLENRFSARVESAIASGDIHTAVNVLCERSGDFTRRVMQLLRLCQNKADRDFVLNAYKNVVGGTSTRVLVSLMHSIKSSMLSELPHRVISAKGGTKLTKAPLPIKVNAGTLGNLKEVVQETLVTRFSELDSLGKVYIDPALYDMALPANLRASTEGALNVGRGTAFKFNDNANWIRFFIHWTGMDIDLSATMHDENFERMGQISWTNLKWDDRGVGKAPALHSGDVTYAPDGAHEFIDINIDHFAEKGRYLVMNVYVYSGGNFVQQEAMAGFMERDDNYTGDLFDPATVKHKVDLTVPTRKAIPFVFDLKERKAYWANIAEAGDNWGNTIDSDPLGTEEAIELVTSLTNTERLNTGQLLALHVMARGELVDSPEEADTVFGEDWVFKAMEINSDFMGD